MIQKYAPEAVEDIPSLSQLPTAVPRFVFREMSGFRLRFWLLTAVSVASTICNFAVIFLLGDLISSYQSLTADRLLWFYAPLIVAAKIGEELLDTFLRRYAEAFPIIFSDHVTLRIYSTILRLRGDRLANYSKERLASLVGRYVWHVQGFLSDWFWSASRKLAKFVIVVGILCYQDWRVALVNLCFFVIFIRFSFSLATRFAPLAQEFAAQNLENRTVLDSFILKLSAVRRLGAGDFYRSTSRQLFEKSWEKLDAVRVFHARRWLKQLLFFHALYLGTLLFGAYQVTLGLLPLGFLLLIKYAFDELLGIAIYAIEYYVTLIQQKEDTGIMNREMTDLFGQSGEKRTPLKLADWNKIKLANIEVAFSAKGSEHLRKISIPSLELVPGSRIGIVGPSGSGKSTVLGVVLGLHPYQGSYSIDNRELIGQELDSESVAVVASSDPLFNVSIRNNILLGRSVSDIRLAEVLSGLKIDEFVDKLDQQIGDANIHLSTGQEQRIKLARGLLVPKDLYLLDEPFAGIDAPTVEKLIDFILQETAGKAVVLVTHREEELRLINEVFGLSAGTLIRKSV